MPSLSFLKLSPSSAWLVLICFASSLHLSSWIHVFLVILISWRLTWLHAHLLQIHVTDVSHILGYHVVLEERTIANLTALRKSAIPSLVAPVLTSLESNLRGSLPGWIEMIAKVNDQLESSSWTSSDYHQIHRLQWPADFPFAHCLLESQGVITESPQTTRAVWEVLLCWLCGEHWFLRDEVNWGSLSHEQVQADTCCQHHLLGSIDHLELRHSGIVIEMLRHWGSVDLHYLIIRCQAAFHLSPSAFLLPRYQLDWLDSTEQLLFLTLRPTRQLLKQSVVRIHILFQLEIMILDSFCIIARGFIPAKFTFN